MPSPTSVVATGGRASTAATPIASRMAGMIRQTMARPVATSRQPTASASAPRTMIAACMRYPGRNRTFTATSAVKAVTTAR